MIEDCRANSWNFRPCLMVLGYRAAHFCSINRKKHIINNFWAAPILILYRFITECILGYEIPAATKIGRRFVIHHGYAIVINKFVIAGDDLTIRQGVTIGNNGKNNECPSIGNMVDIGANAIVIGNIKIGNNVHIGAGSIVVNNVPDNSLITGEKAKIKNI